MERCKGSRKKQGMGVSKITKKKQKSSWSQMNLQNKAKAKWTGEEIQGQTRRKSLQTKVWCGL